MSGMTSQHSGMPTHVLRLSIALIAFATGLLPDSRGIEEDPGLAGVLRASGGSGDPPAAPRVVDHFFGLK
jgi:hypothetical protein